MKEKKERNCIIISMISAALLCVLIFILSTGVSGMLPGQKYYFLYGDATLQFTIFPKALMERLFHGKSLIYSFDIGMGTPTVALYGFYALSPINLLFGMISDIELAGLLVIAVKLMCSAAAMCFLLWTTVKTEKWMAVLLSVAYALNSYVVSFYVSFVLLDALYIFPILVFGLIRLVKERKFGVLSLVYAYSFVIHFYTAYMMGIFSFVLLLVYAWFCFGKNAKLWGGMFLQFGLCVFLAVLMASPLLVPAAYELFSMRTSDVKTIQEFSMHFWEWLAGFYPGQEQGVFNQSPMMYCGILTIILAAAFLFSHEIPRKEKILAGIPMAFLVICTFAQPVYLFMHAFDAPDGYGFRFSWMFCFCLTLMAARECNRIEKDKKAYMDVSAAVALIAVLILLVQYQPDYTQDRMMTIGKIVFILGLLGAYLVFLCDQKHKKSCVAGFGILLCTELFLNFYWGQQAVVESVSLRDEYRVTEQQAQNGLALVRQKEAEDPWEFYRIRYLNYINDNISALYGFHGLGWYSSVEDERVRTLLQNCGYAALPYMLFDYGSTTFMRMLFAQKYSILCGFYYDAEKRDYYEVGWNPYTLPLGYMVDERAEKQIELKENPFENQNLIAEILCGTPHSIFSMHESGYAIEQEGIDFAFLEEGVKVSALSGKGSAAYLLTPEKAGNIYAYMRRWGLSNYLFQDAPKIFSMLDKGGMTNYSMVTMPHIIPLALNEDGYCRLFLQINSESNNTFDYEALYFAYENAEEIKAVYDELLPGAMEVVTFADTEITGKVTVQEDKPILFTSIPYNRYWKVEVDGTQVKTMPILADAFLGVRLAPGEHEVRFLYSSPWVLAGRWAGVVGWGIFAVILLAAKRKEHHRGA